MSEPTCRKCGLPKEHYKGYRGYWRCRPCWAEYCRSQRAAKPEKYRAYDCQRRVEDPQERRQRIAVEKAQRAEESARKRRQRVAGRSRRRRATEPERWREYYRLRVPEQRAAKLQRMAKWADLKAIRAIYTACPDGHHVDHIIPMRGKTAEGYAVSGLHVEGNLQYLTAIANLTKRNRMSPEEQTAIEGRKPWQATMSRSGSRSARA